MTDLRASQVAAPVDRYITVDGARTRYWREGRGPAVVLVHGFAASVEMWTPVLPALAATNEVFALDLLGSGLTDKPGDRPLSPQVLAGFVQSFMATQGIERAALVGHSMGGGISLEVALAAPHLLERLVLVASTGLGQDLLFSLRAATLPVFGWLLTRPTPSTAANFLRKCVHDGTIVDDELVDRFSALGRLPGAHRAMRSQLRAAADLRGWRRHTYHPVLERLPGLDIPTLLVWGRQDRIVPLRHAQEACKRLPRAQMHTFDPCGHLVQLERPHEFASVLRDFVSG